ncbi:hypothetical protein GYA27_02805 [candidate division WWE3 bacterium]|uniref:Glycosyltransferase RgtA/B/C/D-like domain-containing protein n=1 Tax=candidate division WWE3 bacterium TaxID=2053526 RepID=A0A7X9DKI1_UNCKA|nr:hypothetical protein [candidate division WWE3 bacterium]
MKIKPGFKYFILTFLVVIFLALLVPRKINIMVSDIGRHLKNGEIFVTTGKIVDTNYYSYTEPDFSVVNHHWLSGIIFYVIYSGFGFAGLNIIFSLVMGVSMFLIMYLSQNKTGWVVSLSCSLFMSIFILSRLEVRPEVFSCLFFVLYLIILNEFKSGKISFKPTLIILFILQVFWTNLHIFFILGPFLVGSYFLIALIERNSICIRFYGYLLVVTVLAGIINPWGIRGLLEPLLIFRGYEIKVVENMTIFYSIVLHQGNILARDYLLFFIFTLLLGLFSPLFFKKFYLNKSNYVWYAVFIFFGLLTARIMRFVSFYGFYGVYFFTLLLGSVPEFLVYFRKIFRFILPLAIFTLFTFSFSSPEYGFGLLPNSEKASEFYLSSNLTGPILNNYDDGSYIIFYLFPGEKVFVDGRPEAYSSEFQTAYSTRVFEDTKAFENQNTRYSFNTIFLPSSSLNSQTREFVLRLIKTGIWKPVYLDEHALILLKNNAANLSVISKYQIPNLSEKLIVTKHNDRTGISSPWLFLIKIFS